MEQSKTPTSPKLLLGAIRGALFILGAMIAYNLFRFAFSDGIASPGEINEYGIQTAIHLFNFERTHVVLIAFSIAVLARGISHGTVQFVAYRIVSSTALGKEIPMPSIAVRWTFHALHWISRGFAVVSVLVLSPVLDPTKETSLLTIWQTIEPFWNDLFSGDILTVIYIAALFGSVGFLWTSLVDPLNIPAEIQKEAKRQDKIFVVAQKPQGAALT